MKSIHAIAQSMAVICLFLMGISSSYAAWNKPTSWVRSNSSYSDAYARGIPPNSNAYAADLSSIYGSTIDYSDTSSGETVPSGPPVIRRDNKNQSKAKGNPIKAVGGAVLGRGWLWKPQPTPTPPPYTQFSSYSATYHDNEGSNYTQTVTFRPEDYLTDPPPGLVPTDDPVELWIGAGVGRFGDHEFELLGGTDAEPTPIGTFTVISKDAKYWSKKYDAAMPYSVFFKTGYAMHYGALDKPSHGCVHLPYETAQRLYYCTKVGKTKVIIHP
ncbi:MAG: L,D-transpeptidase family protein [Candidatus Sumerlaeales bacterium]|nr:L,D-transpeptidase family protein [Candidatus Sumerlaeales bacterium]